MFLSLRCKQTIVPTEETTIQWSGATAVPLRLDESTGFRFRHVAWPVTVKRLVAAMGWARESLQNNSILGNL